MEITLINGVNVSNWYQIYVPSVLKLHIPTKKYMGHVMYAAAFACPIQNKLMLNLVQGMRKGYRRTIYMYVTNKI